MTPSYLSAMWSAMAPALGNHLWQSTLFAVAAGLLTRVLRTHQARARYWLWLAASVKFLIPFSLLVGMGSRLAWSHASAGTNAGLYSAMNEVSQPFTQPTMSMISPAGPSAVSLNLLDLVPALFIAAWFCGFVVVLSFWYTRWRRISAATREAAPLRDGREVEALRRLQQVGGLRRRIDMLLSRTSLEPGVFGIARPVLIWPEGISEHLEDAHLEAILAHELWHVRRRDNLAAAIHMVVEAIFWFHPLVWWLGARMVEERERACDEEVLALGGERQVYAESILKVCEFCLGSPLACVSGVTGADLKKRMVYIMTERIVRKLDFSRKLLLSVAASLALALPIVFGLVAAPRVRAQAQAVNMAGIAPVYEVTSLKPSRPGSGMARLGFFFTPSGVSATGVTLQSLIREAYGVGDQQISGAPDWVKSQRYDIEAKVDESVADELGKLSEDQRGIATQQMLQALLGDRFKLTLQREAKELPVYALVFAKNGPRLQEAKPGDTHSKGVKFLDGRPLEPGMMSMQYGTNGPDGHPLESGMMMMQFGGGQIAGHGVPMGVLVKQLSEQLNRIVLDKTGLNGKYDFMLQWTPGKSQDATLQGAEESQEGSDGTPSAESSPSIFTAIQQQLGLKLESQKAPMQVLVIDHVEAPAGN
jgi:bla regulator protein BlaR1